MTVGSIAKSGNGGVNAYVFFFIFAFFFPIFGFLLSNKVKRLLVRVIRG